jgi:phosphatidylglycerol lysyltransferase
MLAIVLFSFKHVPYQHGLWLQFDADAELPRALRALLAGAVVLVAGSVLALLRPPRIAARPVTRDEVAQAVTIMRWQDNPEANLVRMRDKQLLFAEDGSAFLMYGVQGSSWIALGDPIGAPSAADELAWRLREMADRAGGRVAFYQVEPGNLPRYVDMGLVPFKLGEEASVNLETFSLEGSSRKGLRQALSRGERDGLMMQIVDPPHDATLLATLRRVSDQWLQTRQAREKRFSLGAFDDAYIGNVPIAIVRRGEAIVAFASLMTTDTGSEAAVDLMRHVDDAPASTMLYLFVKLLLHFQSRGCRRFHLGMAPLSGLEEHPLASTWHRFGHLIYNRGERYYNFRGLRLFKEKFDPDWEPRYLVTQGGINPLLVMADLSTLISGGVQGVFGR